MLNQQRNVGYVLPFLDFPEGGKTRLDLGSEQNVGRFKDDAQKQITNRLNVFLNHQAARRFIIFGGVTNQKLRPP